MKHFWPVILRGTGAYAPDNLIHNDDLARVLDTSDEWIRTRTGIVERRVAPEGECTSTMATRAAERALEDAGMQPDDLDLIICATSTPDHTFPASANLVQRGLGVVGIPSCDLVAACTGFVYACVSATSYLNAGFYRNILVVGAETLTRYSDPTDRATHVLFGDAAGAVVLSVGTDTDQAKAPGLLYCKLGCEARKADCIVHPAGGSRMPTSQATLDERLQYLRMQGREVYKFAVNKLQELIGDALTALEISPDDLSLIIPHQSNLRIIESATEKLGLASDKVATNIDRYGNTSAASIPIALDEARRAGRLKSGDLILMVAIGAGLTFGAAVVRL
jgi:3-oxoacyl-[acyl-carrier-protein] synthase-3